MDVRYQGQGYELNVPYTRNLIRDFRSEHQRRYGYSYPAREVELVTLRLRATIKSQQASSQGSTTGQVGTGVLARPGRAKPGSEFPRSCRCVFLWKKAIGRDRCPVTLLPAGKKYSGPAVITEYSATTVVPPGMSFPTEIAPET